MADVLFVTWDGGGNVPPALGLAAELQHRGHTVRFLGHAQQRPTIEGAGFGFDPYTRARPWSSTEPSSGPSAAFKFITMFTDNGPGVDLLENLAHHPAEFLVIDCMSLGALRAAERAGLRRAVLVHTYYRFLTHSWSRGPVGLAARLKGQPPEQLWTKADVLLVAADRALDPARDKDLPASLHHVGVVQSRPLHFDSAPDAPDAPGAPPEHVAGDAAPAVLVSLSTTYFPGQDQSLQSILDALAGLPVRGIVTTGAAVDPGQLRAPANVEVHRYRDHGDVMPAVDLVIGHGGHATTMRALSHDLPLLVMPMHPMLDQKMIGQSVERQGAAKLLRKTASAEQIRDTVRQLLEPGPHRHAAALIGARLRKNSGAVAAADRLSTLLA